MTAPDYGALRSHAFALIAAVNDLEGERVFGPSDEGQPARLQACEVAVLKAARSVKAWLDGLTRTEGAA